MAAIKTSYPSQNSILSRFRKRHFTILQSLILHACLGGFLLYTQYSITRRISFYFLRYSLYINYLVWSKGNAEQQYNLVYFNLTIEKQQQLANIDGSTLKYKCIGPFVIDGNLENSCGNRNYCQGSWSEKCGE